MGVNVDLFRHFRGVSVVELAALSRAEIVGVHVTDVPDLPKAELGDGDRMLPGDGVIPPRGILESHSVDRL